MSEPTDSSGSVTVTAGGADLDVREVPKPQRHPLIFARFESLAVGESFVLVNSHDPKHLREEFERELPGSYDWTYLPTGDARLWRVRITRRAATELPRVLADTTALLAGLGEPQGHPDGAAAGAVWRLEPRARQLDANVIRLRPDARIEAHLGPDLDVLLHVLQGSGRIVTAVDPIPVHAGALVWLPRRSQRAVLAGPDGLTYLSVHPRRPALGVAPAAAGTPDPGGAGAR